MPPSMQKAIDQADLTKPSIQIQTFDRDNRQFNQGMFSETDSAPPQALLTEFEYQNPIVFQIKFMCQDAAAANKMAEGFRGPAGQKSLGLLNNLTIEVKDTTVVMRATMSASLFCGGSILK